MTPPTSLHPQWLPRRHAAQGTRSAHRQRGTHRLAALRHLDPARAAIRLALIGVMGLMSLLSACGGGGGDGAAVEARSQTLSVDAAPTAVATGSITVRVSASSQLPVRYSSSTPSVCAVDSRTGVVTITGHGTCRITATQSGDETYAPASPVTMAFTAGHDPAQTIHVDVAPTLSLGGSATIVARATSGLAVRYSSLTPSVCSVDAITGQVTDLLAGVCRIAADQDGDAYYLAAATVVTDLLVEVPSGITVPGAPSGVTVTLGDDGQHVRIQASAVDSGGSAITHYTARSVPAGITGQGSTLPLTLACNGPCAGHAFMLAAGNAVGTGSPGTATDILTRYTVRAIFHEPDTQPRDTVFTGSLTVNTTRGEVSGLSGELTESMTGSATGDAPLYDMTRLPLTQQLSSIQDDALGGLLVTVFRNADTRTFTTAYGGDGWSPDAGVAIGGIHAGFPVAANNPGNAYVRLFINPAHPLAPLQASQIAKLAYADCAPGGMMGAVCMTGTSVAGYGAVGTMSGYPVSQVLTRLP